MEEDEFSEQEFFILGLSLPGTGEKQSLKGTYGSCGIFDGKNCPLMLENIAFLTGDAV